MHLLMVYQFHGHMSRSISKWPMSTDNLDIKVFPDETNVIKQS